MSSALPDNSDAQTIDSWGGNTQATAVTVGLVPTGQGTFACPRHPEFVSSSKHGICDHCEGEFARQRDELRTKRQQVSERLRQLSFDASAGEILQDLAMSMQQWKPAQEEVDDVPRPPRYPHQQQPTPQPPQNPFALAHPAPALDALTAQIQSLQRMQDWMLYQKEQECQQLREKLEDSMREANQLRVENALLQEKLNQQEQRMQHELKLIKLAAQQRKKSSNITTLTNNNSVPLEEYGGNPYDINNNNNHYPTQNYNKQYSPSSNKQYNNIAFNNGEATIDSSSSTEKDSWWVSADNKDRVKVHNKEDSFEAVAQEPVIKPTALKGSNKDTIPISGRLRKDHAIQSPKHKQQETPSNSAFRTVAEQPPVMFVAAVPPPPPDPSAPADEILQDAITPKATAHKKTFPTTQINKPKETSKPKEIKVDPPPAMNDDDYSSFENNQVPKDINVNDEAPPEVPLEENITFGTSAFGHNAAINKDTNKVSFVDDTASVGQTVASSTYGEDRLKVINQNILDPYGDRGDYTGIVLRSTGMPHGQGRMIYHEDKRTYDGEWRHGRWHGFGRATFANGDSYEGEYRFDQRHGRGRYVWNDGRIYDGMFREDKRHGFGSFTWPDGAKYEGEFCNGQREGHGVYLFSDGGKYEGSWKDGRYNGYGVCHWEDGRRYKGEWLNGMAHGKGVETFADGAVRHDGQWIEDEPVV